jgi:ethanolamine ammonia-lyase small subunit
MDLPIAPDDPWRGLRRFTAARIALGRSGDSAPTRVLLDFGLAHAQARDAVHLPLDRAALAASLSAADFDVLTVHSAAVDRTHFLRRPDLGRQLDAPSREALSRTDAAPMDLLFVIGDGLSARAVSQHALPLIEATRARLGDGWRLGPVVVAGQARVALGDEIGERLGAPLLVMLIGERPGLSSPDSLGLYLTHAPHVGCSDAQRNCISNVRPEGLGYEAAATKLCWLLHAARRLQLTGVGLKDESDLPALRSTPDAAALR